MVRLGRRALLRFTAATDRAVQPAAWGSPLHERTARALRLAFYGQQALALFGPWSPDWGEVDQVAACAEQKQERNYERQREIAGRKVRSVRRLKTGVCPLLDAARRRGRDG